MTKTRTLYRLRYEYPTGRVVVSNDRVWPTREEAERVALRAGAYGDRVVTVDQYTEPVPDTIATYRIGGTS